MEQVETRTRIRRHDRQRRDPPLLERKDGGCIKGLGITEAKNKFVYPSKSDKSDDHDQDAEQASTVVTPTKNKPAATPQDTTASDGSADADIEEADERSPEDSGPRACTMTTIIKPIWKRLRIFLRSIWIRRCHLRV